MERWKWSCLF